MELNGFYLEDNEMNLTLSADKEMINKSRRYAKEQGTSLNGIIREFLKKISGEDDCSANALEFAELAQNMSGCSTSGYVFDREEIHNRDQQR